MAEHVIVNDEAGIRTIRMNRPEKKNALTTGNVRRDDRRA